MCLLFVAIDAAPGQRLVIAGNRDEFYERPTAGAGFWDDAPAVLAGRDLQAGGTWLGVTREGRWAAVTNYREGSPEPASRSRGDLVSDFLRGSHTAERYAEAVLARGAEYGGFNLLVGDGQGAYHCSNREATLNPLSPGIYGLSNHLLDTPWPKLERGKARFAASLSSGGTLDESELFALLGDREEARPDVLPDTGVGPELERALSPAFIALEHYGTRSSTVLELREDGWVNVTERTYLQPVSGPRNPELYEARTLQFQLT